MQLMPWELRLAIYIFVANTLRRLKYCKRQLMRRIKKNTSEKRFLILVLVATSMSIEARELIFAEKKQASWNRWKEKKDSQEKNLLFLPDMDFGETRQLLTTLRLFAMFPISSTKARTGLKK